MKINTNNIEPNPFRKIKTYPVDKKKVKALKSSIAEKTFWDNILVRPHPTKKGKYQLAYGHHRLIALKELGISRIDIPCKKIDDSMMLQIMAEENLNWSTSPIVMTQTIISAKEFLDKELTKYKTWDEFSSEQTFISNLGIDSEPSFRKLKGSGVGRNTLVKFLGGNWTERRVQDALNMIKDDNLDKEAMNTIPTMEQASKFRASVKRCSTPKKTQKKIAKEIVKEGVGKRDIPKLVEERTYPAHKIQRKEKKDKVHNVVEYVMSTETKVRDLSNRFDKLMPEIPELMKKGRLLARLVSDTNDLLGTINCFLDKCKGEYDGNNKKTKKVASTQVLDRVSA